MPDVSMTPRIALSASYVYRNGTTRLAGDCRAGKRTRFDFDFFRDIEWATGHSDWRARQTARLKLDILVSVENAMFPAHAGGPQTRV
jgi:hypothetical protein